MPGGFDRGLQDRGFGVVHWGKYKRRHLLLDRPQKTYFTKRRWGRPQWRFVLLQF